MPLALTFLARRKKRAQPAGRRTGRRLNSSVELNRFAGLRGSLKCCGGDCGRACELRRLLDAFAPLCAQAMDRAMLTLMLLHSAATTPNSSCSRASNSLPSGSRQPALWCGAMNPLYGAHFVPCPSYPLLTRLLLFPRRMLRPALRCIAQGTSERGDITRNAVPDGLLLPRAGSASAAFSSTGSSCHGPEQSSRVRSGPRQEEPSAFQVIK